LAEEVWRNIQKRPTEAPVLNETMARTLDGRCTTSGRRKTDAALIEAADIIVADVKAGRSRRRTTVSRCARSAARTS